MNEFLQILNDSNDTPNDTQPKEEKQEKEKKQEKQDISAGTQTDLSAATTACDVVLSACNTQTCDPAWSAVLTNAFCLYYPGPDGDNKNREFLRPLYVVLNALREMGAGLTKVKKSDGSEHFKLVQGTMPAQEWETARTGLAQSKDSLMWLFTISVMGVVGEEEEKHRPAATTACASHADRSHADRQSALEISEASEDTAKQIAERNDEGQLELMF